MDIQSDVRGNQDAGDKIALDIRKRLSEFGSGDAPTKACEPQGILRFKSQGSSQNDRRFRIFSGTMRARGSPFWTSTIVSPACNHARIADDDSARS
jgi:hypothetical protein